jgi:hypothetical protein
MRRLDGAPEEPAAEAETYDPADEPMTDNRIFDNDPVSEALMEITIDMDDLYKRMGWEREEEKPSLKIYDPEEDKESLS